MGCSRFEQTLSNFNLFVLAVKKLRGPCPDFTSLRLWICLRHFLPFLPSRKGSAQGLNLLPFRELSNLRDPHVFVEVLQHIHDTLEKVGNFPILSPPGHSPAEEMKDLQRQIQWKSWVVIPQVTSSPLGHAGPY